jgi:hypothetical protein
MSTLGARHSNGAIMCVIDNRAIRVARPQP